MRNNNGMKMVTGLVTAPGFGGVLRIAAFAAMTAGCWWFYNWAMTLDWTSPGFTTFPIAIVAMTNMAVSLVFFCPDGRLSHLPFTLWRRMTRDEVKVWALLIWPILIPAELITCVIITLGHLLNAKLWTRSD